MPPNSLAMTHQHNKLNFPRLEPSPIIIVWDFLKYGVTDQIISWMQRGCSNDCKL